MAMRAIRNRQRPAAAAVAGYARDRHLIMPGAGRQRIYLD